MHRFYDYVCGQLEEYLKKRRIVVFYDPRREFERFVDVELPVTESGHDGLARVLVTDRLVFLARYEGSFFALRRAVEPIVEADWPDTLVIYLPGVERNRQGSVLMELETSGKPYEPQLKRLARNVLRKYFTEGQIDEMLRSVGVSYDDIVSFVRQGEEGTSASVLRTIFDVAQSEALIAQWLVDPTKDESIVEKDSTAELYKLVESRLGMSIPANTTLGEIRDKLIRYVLVAEFRSDLGCDPPPSLEMIPVPPSDGHLKRIRDLVDRLRLRHADDYAELANKVESNLGLGSAMVSASHLGSIDTFRFEERTLLSYVGELICVREYNEALGIVTGRDRSFWVDRDIRRQAQWEACRLMAQLGHEIQKVRPVLDSSRPNPTSWVYAYAADSGLFRVDALQRRVDTWVAKMDEEPETGKALAVVRREHEEFLKKMADQFGKTLTEAAWAVPGVLHQTRIYPDVVGTMGERVAYFLVDAMRFDMGVELGHQLDGASDLTIRPAIAALPTITTVGMAALLPGASASFSVVEQEKKLAVRIEGSSISGLSDRLRRLKTKVPGAIDISLGKLLGTSPSILSKATGDASLVVVRSQEIDALGENVDELTARAAMDGIIGNVARAIRKLASVGIENFVVTADHGHQFSIPKDDDMKTDHPAGVPVELHRRCWIGHGGTAPPGTIRVSGAELGYDTNLDFVFPTGLGVFKAGGGLSYHHGGASLQELVIPVVSFRFPSRKSRAPGDRTAQLSGVPVEITNRTFGVRVLVTGDLFLAEPVAVRVVVISRNEQVGQAGLAIGGDLDRTSGVLQIDRNSEASVGMMLTRDDCDSVRVVVLDPATDAVMDQSEELPVKLGI